jgi:hypothetical protein
MYLNDTKLATHPMAPSVLRKNLEGRFKVEQLEKFDFTDETPWEPVQNKNHKPRAKKTVVGGIFVKE